MPKLAIRQAPQAAGRSHGPGQGKGSKTTILAMRVKDGLVMAADRRCVGWGYELVNEDEIKIDQITDDSAIASCGLLSSGQWILDQLRVQARQFENTTGCVLSMRGQVRIASELCRQSYDGGFNFNFGGLLCGLDVQDNPRIFEIEEGGGRVEHHRFYATGSGGPSALPVLRLQWRPDMATDRALELAVRALYLAGLSNAGTSDIRLVMPVLVTILRGEGFVIVPPERTVQLQQMIGKELEGVR
jgi:20S proteasome alpha/beta subunit